MFGLLRPRPPIGAWEKAWVETRMHWLARHFDVQRLFQAEVILPTEEYFPGVFEGTAEDAGRYLDLVCRYMRAGASQLRIEVCEDCSCSTGPPAAGGDSTDRVIQLPQTRLADPQLLVATLAHAVAYDLLNRDRLLDRLHDAPWVADLLPVFLGLGIFGANSAVRETSVTALPWHASQMRQYGYLPTRMLGYALALFAWIRDEPRPHWVRHLRRDGSALFEDALRYMRRTGDSLFGQSSLHVGRESLSVDDLIVELESRSDSTRIAALWTLAERGGDAAAALDSVTRCLRARDASLRAEAAVTLAAMGVESDAACEALIDCLRDVQPHVRACAARTLGGLRGRAEQLVYELTPALRDESPAVVGAAADAIRQLGAGGEELLDDLLAAFRRALVHCHKENTQLLAAALKSVAPDADRQVERLFDEYDAELREVALELLAEPTTEKPV